MNYKDSKRVIAYRNAFNKDNYDRANICFAKGHKQAITEHFKAKGYKSLNAYVNDLISRDMQATEGTEGN